MNKKALSPLMATILLVAFALVVGTVTMNVGKKYVEETDAEPETGETGGEAFGSSIVIDINDVLGDDLKELQIRYITGKITIEEYLAEEKDIIG